MTQSNDRGTRTRILATILGLAIGSGVGTAGGAMTAQLMNRDAETLPAWGGTSLLGTTLSGSVVGAGLGLWAGRGIARRNEYRRRLNYEAAMPSRSRP